MRQVTRSFVLLTALSVLLCSCRSEPSANNLTRKVDAYLEPLVEQRELSGVVAIARGDEMLVERAYGFADFESEIAHSTGNSFAIASLSKTFTSAAIEILASRRDLSFSDLLSTYITDFPRGHEITLEMLLLHQSGVAEQHQFPDYMERREEALSLTEQVKRIAEQPLQFDPGSDSSYSNSGYIILARVVEIVSKNSFGEFLEDELFSS